ncbi:Autophagy-related protein [Lachnellula hyalina]|uniref:Autophagy-related protein n=1 Tax=Lachnellula hyalina TaxID=1316788 RepID=A0A8H8R5H8_9HELO|nr:Autophagy-related protein [Lachnellula hyalina]TVY28903.1 Autophagy-related protein [Lachnellula hyalina]
MVRSEPRPNHQQRTLSSNSTKHSFLSYSSSFEADDERSSDADHDSPSMSMGPDLASAFRDSPSQYAGEDTRLTSRKELSGWYAYGFAAEVFVICGMGSFIPITLEQLARDNGVLLSDLTTPCPSSSSHAPGGLPGTPGAAKDTGQCVVLIAGMQINTASFAMYTFSLSVLFQAILVVSISCAADHGNYRKRLLLFFAFAGSIATMLFLPIVPKVYLLGALLAMISNTCFGASFVLLNSFLPLLVRHHPKTQYSSNSTPDLSSSIPGDELEEGFPGQEEEEEEDNLVDSTAALLSPAPDTTRPNPASENLSSIELQLSTQISSTGIGIGYSAGLFVQCSCIVVVFAMQKVSKSSTLSLRVVLFIIGAWWFIFTFPAAMWLRPRPGPPLPSGDPSDPKAKRTWLAYFVYSWSSLWRTVKLARRLKDITLFLAAWFLISDAIATVSGTAVLYAKTQLGMHPAALGLINVIATTAGVLGAFTWAAISRWLGLRPHQTILACICIFEVIPLYGLLGYLPFVKNWGVIGLQQPWEMYPLGFVYGFVLGGLSSYCRSLYGELIPPGSEAAFYALYAITDKGSSVFGPAIVGAIVDRTGEIRPAFWFLAVLVGLPAPLLWFVNVDRGKEEGARLAEIIEGFKTQEGGQASSNEDHALLASDDEAD